MKNGIFWLIGILAIINGIIGCVYPPLLAIYAPETISLKSIQYVLSTWILIYGGYQTLRRNASGPKLLRIFFCIEIIKLIIALVFTAIMFLIFGNSFGYRTELNDKPILSTDPLAIYIYSYLAFYATYCILSFIFLSPKNITEDFLADRPQHNEKVGKILSVIAPGLGQAFVEKYWSGIIRFLIFYMLMNALNFFVKAPLSQNDSNTVAVLMDSVIKLIIWFFSSINDWTSIDSYLKDQHTAQAVIEEPPA